jgi:hypothetical protein
MRMTDEREYVTIRFRAVATSLLMVLSPGFALAGCGNLLAPYHFAQTCSHTVDRHSSGPVRTSAIFVADPQFHHVLGQALRSSSLGMDAIASTAIRPPSLNLLAPTVFRLLVSEARTRVGPDGSGVPLIVLGDATNIACTSEWQTFSAVMAESAAGGPWLVAHGNHDSFMMGNLRSIQPPRPGCDIYNDLPHAPAYTPGRTECRCDPADALCASTGWCDPTAYSFWTGAQSAFLAYNTDASCRVTTREGWAGICATPDESSAPMNKLAWMAGHLRSIAAQGGIIPRPEQVESGAEFEIAVDPASVLARADYVARGAIYWPSTFLGSVWRSFLVQRVALSATTDLILLDTAVVEFDGGAIGRGYSLAGRNGEIGTQQLGVLRRMLAESAGRGRRVLLGGHFPLDFIHDLPQLYEVVAGSSAEVVGYVSAHRHAPFTSVDWCIGRHMLHEWNIGSTTDWPMEASLFLESPSSSNPEWRQIVVRELAPESSCSSRYRSQGRSLESEYFDGISQACSHSGAAEALLSRLEQSPSDPGDFVEPIARVCDAGQLLETATGLRGAMTRIDALLRDPDPVLRVAREHDVLCVAAGASSAHGPQE